MEAASPVLTPSAAPVAHYAALEALVDDLLAAARSGSSSWLEKVFEMLRARLTDLAAEQVPWELRAKLETAGGAASVARPRPVHKPR